MSIASYGCLRHGKEGCPVCIGQPKPKKPTYEELEAQLQAYQEALTPSGKTKAAYHGETEASWTTTKDVMRLIRERATGEDGT